MNLYYQDEHVTLYHGDCLTEHREWLDADVLVTDPPYGMSWQSGQRKGPKYERISGDNDIQVRDTALTEWGTSKPGIIFGAWRVPPPKPNGSDLSGRRRGILAWVI